MKLKVYTTTNCLNCKAVKSYLAAMDVKYEEVRVDSPEMVKQMQEKTGFKKTPVVENGKGSVMGFRPDKIEQLVLE